MEKKSPTPIDKKELKAYNKSMKKHLKAKWTRKDGWKAKQFVCIHSAGPIRLTLYSDPDTEKKSWARVLRETLKESGLNVRNHLKKVQP